MMRLPLGLALLLLTPAVAHLRAAPDQAPDTAVTFEVHAVADRATAHTQRYLGLNNAADGKAETLLLVEPPLLDSKSIRLVTLDYAPDASPVIMIALTEDGTKLFENLTKENIGKQIGLVIGGQLYSVPRIMEIIHGGKIAINGTFSPREAANLVERLNAGLPGKMADR